MNSTYNTLGWIPPDPDLGNGFTQPPAEQVLQLIYNIKNTHAKHTRSLTAIQ